MRTIIVLFGITGDLSRRKLLPALEEICREIPKPYEVIGVSRRQVDVGSLVGDDSRLRDVTSIETLDLADTNDYKNLWDRRLAKESDAKILVYLAVPPLSMERILRNLSASGFRNPNVQILIEKPFGTDVRSSEDLFHMTKSLFDADQLYFVDHYLGKRVAREIIKFREANPDLSRVWNRNFIKSIDVVATESLDIEGRAAFYEQTGALRDVLQGHLLQLLALTIGNVADDDLGVKFARMYALKNLLPANPKDTLRAQYAEYRKDAGSPNSQVETFAKVTFYSDSPAWQGVPMTLTTGKNLAEKQTYVRVNFRTKDGAFGGYIKFAIQPEDGVVVELSGDNLPVELASIAQHISGYEVDDTVWNGYQAILVDGLNRRTDYFVSEAEVIASWQAVDDVLVNWDKGIPELRIYPAHSTLDQIESA